MRIRYKRNEKSEIQGEGHHRAQGQTFLEQHLRLEGIPLATSNHGHMKIETENNSYINFYSLHCDEHLPCLFSCSSHSSRKGADFLNFILQEEIQP